MTSVITSNRLSSTDGATLAAGRRLRPNSSARMEIAAYSPVVKSAMAGPGLAGIPG
jgi:hypothetical protein